MTYLTLLALLPGILIIIYIFRKDKTEREPVSLIIKLVVLGAVSCIPAGLLEGWIERYLPYYGQGTLFNAVIIAFLSAGLMEEVCKFLFLKLGSWNDREFNCTFDGVVYGVAVAIGFACYENMNYVMAGGLHVALTRAVLAVPLHAFCGAFMGLSYGRAKKEAFRGNTGKSRSLQFRGIITAILIHGTYDTFAMWDLNLASILLLAFVAVMYVTGITMINKAAREDEWMTGDNYFVPSYDNPEMKRISHVNGLSIASFVCGILAFLSYSVFILPSVLAIVLGILGRRKGRNGLATAGIAIGIISLLINIYLLGIYWV